MAKPKGVINRTRADWYEQTLASCYYNSPSVAGQSSYCRLHNNTVRGFNLYVVGFTFIAVNYVGLFLESGQSSLGTLFVNQPKNVNPLTPAIEGQLYTFSALTCIATVVGLIGANNTFVSYFPSFPLAVIPPGWDFLWHCDTVTTVVKGSIWYYAAPQK